MQLPDRVDALHLAERALARGISVTPGPLFSASGAYRNCLRLNCGHIWTDRFDAAVKTLAGEIIRLRCS